jgi:hypothetical protein
MTNGNQPQNDNENLLNFDEAKSAIEKGFASAIGTLGINNALLEKKLAVQSDIIQQLTANEAALVERIQDLEAEIYQLRNQLSNIPKPLSPEAAALAAAGSAFLASDGDEGNKKAAPVEAA